MIAAERREAVLRELRLRGSLSVAEFAGRLAVSPITLRRDLAELERAGRLTRVHGGATALQQVPPGPVAFERSAQQLAATFGLAPRDAGDSSAVATIGMVVPTRSYYYASIIEGAQSAAWLAGVRLTLAISDYNEAEERRVFERMLHLGLDGVLITPSRSELGASPLRELVETSTVPVTVLERVWEFPTRGRAVDSVRSDHRYGGELGARHLVELGHRRIGLWTFANPHVGEISAGFRAAADAAGCHVHTPSFDFGHPEWNSLDPMQNVRRYVDEAVGAGVTALVVHPDELALQVVQAALDRGVDVPSGLSVVAYDDEVASLAERPMTAVSPPKRAIGFAAIDACLRAIAHVPSSVEDFPAQRIRLLPTLRVRETSGPPGGRGPQ
ncbi:LacI family DNA-binding transcriptional regulator [Kineococcus sp. SYSU DK001]|uniref:LacI family DNA-binding transcriptional regulator n=1 Tax=Kineococcus sp. SYSU DK001 TaxID=3383122 RepID=UPI003D7E1F4F